MIRFLEGYGRDMQRMAKDYPDCFMCYIAWMFLACEIIHACIVI